MGAMGLPSVDCCHASTTQDVLPARDFLEMVWIAATTIATQVVKLQTWREPTPQQMPR